ncbi:hypothetical protein [Demequina sp.]|uniref:hypothetical protein n=1 Tax=Demequina sp. TaxID=2050685 RepID=UPI003A8728D7
MAEIGSAELTVIPSFKGGQRALEKQLGGVSGSAGAKAGKASGTAFLGGMKSMIGPAAGILGGAFAVDFAKDAIAEASDLGESLNALNVTYGDASEGVAKLGEEAARNLGLSNVDFNNLAVQFSAFSKTIAGEGGNVTGTLDDLTTRASDFASVMNLDVAESASLFQSGLAGETEPLRRYGIDLSAAAVEAYALADATINTADGFSEAEKVQARYGSLMEQTAQTQGDFANTSGELANSQRILSAEWDNMRAELGTKFLPVATEVTGWILNEGLPAFQSFIDDLDDPTTSIGSIVDSLGTIGGAAATAAESLWDAFGDDVINFIDVGAGYGSALLEGFSDVVGAYEEGGMPAALEKAAEKGAALSVWADSGDSVAQQWVNGMDEGFRIYFEEGFPGLASALWEGFVYSVTPTVEPAPGDLSFDLSDQPKTPFNPDDVIPSITAPSSLSLNSRAGDVPSITAPSVGGTSYGNSADYGVIVNINKAEFSDSSDVARKAQQTARSNSWSGSRNGRGIDPRLTR